MPQSGRSIGCYFSVRKRSADIGSRVIDFVGAKGVSSLGILPSMYRRLGQAVLDPAGSKVSKLEKCMMHRQHWPVSCEFRSAHAVSLMDSVAWVFSWFVPLSVASI
jgi:hypothetical protein